MDLILRKTNFITELALILRGYCIMLIISGLFLACVGTHVLHAQNTSLEFWPETDIWYRISPSLRLSVFMPVTKYYESKNRDLNIYIQGDYAWGYTKRTIYIRMMDENRSHRMKAWLARAGLMEGWSLYDRGENYTEDMLFGEIHKRVPLKKAVLISQRIRTDLRWLGHDPEFSGRLRYRIMVEKEFTPGKISVVPYINAEPFYDSRFDYFNRLRVCGGATLVLKSWYAFEGNLTYQYDSRSFPTHVYAVNLIAHIFFETRRAKTHL